MPRDWGADRTQQRSLSLLPPHHIEILWVHQSEIRNVSEEIFTDSGSIIGCPLTEKQQQCDRVRCNTLNK